MRTSIGVLGESLVIIAKFDNTDKPKAFTIETLNDYVDGIINNYGLEDDEEEALYALMQALKAATYTMDEGDVRSSEE